MFADCSTLINFIEGEICRTRDHTIMSGLVFNFSSLDVRKDESRAKAGFIKIFG